MIVGAVIALPGPVASVTLTAGDVLLSGYDGSDQPNLLHFDGETGESTHLAAYATQVLAEGPNSVLLAGPTGSGVLNRLDLTSGVLTQVASGLPSSFRLEEIDAAGRVYYITGLGTTSREVRRLDLATQTTTVLYSGPAVAAAVDPSGTAYVGRISTTTPSQEFELLLDLFSVDGSGSLALLETANVGVVPFPSVVDFSVGPGGERIIFTRSSFRGPQVEILRTAGSPGGGEFIGSFDDQGSLPDVGPSGEVVWAHATGGVLWDLDRKYFGQPGELVAQVSVSFNAFLAAPTIEVVPEPALLTLLGAALVAELARRRRT
jgi:hypothetical protein